MTTATTSINPDNTTHPQDVLKWSKCPHPVAYELRTSLARPGDQYAVVKFPEEGNSVALVHTKWLHGDVYLWPQASKNVSYLAKCGASPSSNWQVVPCVPIDTFRTYDAARQKLKQAEDGSDLGSEVDLGGGKRKKKATKSPQLKSGKCAATTTSTALYDEKSTEEGRETYSQAVITCINIKQAKWEIHSATMRSGIQVSLLHLFQVRELAALGGTNVSLSARRILEALMTQEVAVQYSWLGQKGKKFLSLTTCDFIYKSVKCTFETVKRSEVEDVVKTWLRHAGDKLRKNNKQSEKVTGRMSALGPTPAPPAPSKPPGSMSESSINGAMQNQYNG
ncbi:uncharacterized protein LOC142570770 [Dermacentor variabilis]|uniref:uncharacterized protein LOC142570770 n=1 Tax=Dermacentor variabilis TaxID=34621 RepID=UPI003F5B3D64